MSELADPPDVDDRILIEVDLDTPELGAAVDVQEATTSVDCRGAGCPNEAKWTRGKYAFLCADCADKKREAASADNWGAGRGSVETVREAIGHVDPETGLPATGSLRAAVKSLVAPAARLERATEGRRLARAEAIAAVEEFNDALRVLRELAQRLIA